MGKNRARYGGLVALLAVALMVFALSGCGSDPTQEPAPAPTATSAPADTGQTESPAPAPAVTPTPAPADTGQADAPAPAPAATPTPRPAGGQTQPPAETGPTTQEPEFAGHFDDEPVTIVVGSAPGGGYDLLARTIARFAPQHLPGEPERFQIRNVSGGGGLRAWETLLRSEPDGRTILTLNINLIRQVLLGREVSGLDLNTLPLIGAPTRVSDPYLICADRHKYSSWDDLLADGSVTIAGGTGGRVPMGAHFVELVGGPMKTIPGYEGSTETLAAFERGELEASTCIQRRDPRLLPELVEDMRWLPLFWWNTRPKQEWLDTLGAPEPYHIYDLPGVEFQDWQKTAFNATVEYNDFLRMYVVHPDTPPGLIEIWRDSYQAVIEDPGFIEAAGIAGYDVGFGSPDDFGQVIEDLLNLPPEGLELVLRLSGIN